MTHVQSTFDEMIQFIATATAKGWIGQTSGNAILSTLRRMKPFLEENEKQDVAAIKLEPLIRRFSNLNRDVGSSSLKSYTSRLGSAIRMFSEWRKDPTTWKPRSSGSVANSGRKTSKTAPTDAESNEAAETPINDDRLSYPFPLRDGIVLKFVGLPRDLTQADVERIGRFLRVLCVD